jgi:hypothetical protein
MNHACVASVILLFLCLEAIVSFHVKFPSIATWKMFRRDLDCAKIKEWTHIYTRNYNNHQLNAFDPTRVRQTDGKKPFSRVVQTGQVPRHKPVLCKLIASPDECIAIGKYHDVDDLRSLTANVSLSWVDDVSIVVKGRVEGVLGLGIPNEEDVPKYFPISNKISRNYTSLLLIGEDVLVPGEGAELIQKYSKKSKTKDFQKERYYDDEITNGWIDIGDITLQYFVMRLFT